MEDFYPRTAANVAALGRDATSRPINRRSLAQLAACGPPPRATNPLPPSPRTAPEERTLHDRGADGVAIGAAGDASGGACSTSGGPVPRAQGSQRGGQTLVLTPVFFISVTANATGFAMFSTVHDDDPTRTVLSAVAVLEDYFASVLAVSPHVVVAVTDHTGAMLPSPHSACGLGGAEEVVSHTVAATGTQEWRVDVGMCPAFRLQHPEHVHGLRDRATYLTFIACAAAATVAGVLLMTRASQRELKLQVSLAEQVCCQ